ncbi:GntR family transcriptional regulator [Vibrio nitrifigilis]|uniref:GntR family transcriptional regulator n=1 Tax=Vibrio nitrifigilis TaxID=2789781 RepID=A0ABS0GIJ1_9VIBR|nr:GntR family transcriptional regulator [Vibrio nitrifigilis]MBF9002110.1 GntR family transcriptional regulator [Vibrio nitrifigilis]
MTIKQTTAASVLKILKQENFAVGAHLSAQYFADKLSLSRSPINRAFATLAERGILVKQPMRGYFVTKVIEDSFDEAVVEMGLVEKDVVESVYFKIAEDRLRGELGDVFSEKQIKKRYDLTMTQLQSVINKIAEEGWINKKPGYGWEFSPMLTTPESLMQTYRVRLALEPAALLEPGYFIAPEVIEECRQVELKLIAKGTSSSTTEQLHQRGVNFHQAIIEASGNPFFIDTLARINKVRRLLSYRSMQDRTRYLEHAQQHLAILDLLEQKRNAEASEQLRQHLASTISNIEKINQLLK